MISLAPLAGAPLGALEATWSAGSYLERWKLLEALEATWRAGGYLEHWKLLEALEALEATKLLESAHQTGTCLISNSVLIFLRLRFILGLSPP